MAARSRLRAVNATESAPQPPQSVAQAAASGSQRELLIAMRERIAQTVSDPDCPPRDLASLTRRLQDIAKDLAVVDARAAHEAEQDDLTDDRYGGTR